MRRDRTVLVAIGGNALLPPGEQGTVAQGLAHARTVARDLAQLVADGRRLVITHGNGPQVGIILRRSDLTAAIDPALPPLPLSYCVAETQGGIGHLLATALREALRGQGLGEQVAPLLMQTVVDADDPAFAAPTKPIGPFYSAPEAESIRRHRDWQLVEDAGRGYRRVVPSPRPRRALGIRAVRSLLDAGYTVITGGGGGIPLIERGDGTYEPVDAVIDKDRLSALLAAQIGAATLVLSTSVERVALDFGRPSQRELAALGADEAARHLAEGQFPPGSMGPKIEAALAFLEAQDGEVLITSLERVRDALDRRTGTRITRQAAVAYAR